MNRRWRQLSLLALACTLSVGCSRPQQETGIERVDTTESSGATMTRVAARSSLVTLTAAAPAERFQPPEILCGSNLACLESPLVASTPEELAWLRANGYPSLRELRQLRAASSDALAEEVAQGSRTAMVILGARLVRQRRLGDGLDLMRHAADAGSIYAYYELSSAQMHNPWLGGLVESAAFLRVAYLLGDVKAAGVMQRRFSMLGPGERVLVDERAATLYRTYAKNRLPNPRPMEME